MSEYTDQVLANLLEYLKTHPEVRHHLSDAWYVGFATRDPDDVTGADWRDDPFSEPPNGTYRG
jgi:hypothetical protein